MISNQEIESFLHGNDPEEFIVAIEFDYASNSIYKIKEIPGKGKEIRKDTFIPFAWVGDLKGLKRPQGLDIDQGFPSTHFAGRHSIHHLESSAEIGRVLVTHFLADGTDGFFGGT